MSLSLNWRTHKDTVLSKIESAIDSLCDAVYLPTQLEEMARVCVVPLFRYSASLVTWTAGELAALSTKLAGAIKVAWKVNQGCSAAPVWLATADTGWGSPSAEVLYAQEMWSSYHQFHQHKDDLSRISAYDLEYLQLDMGADTLRELQEEILLKPAGTSFYERFLRHLASMGV